MFLTAAQIERNIAWLLAHGSPPVRYLTHRHLLGTPADAPQMVEHWQAVEACDDVREIFARQEPDGSWYSGGSWAHSPSYMGKGGWDPYNPKYVTATWILPLLGEIGYTAADSRIRRACDYTLTHGYYADPIWGDPTIPADGTHIRHSPCRFAQYLIALAEVGLAQDPLVQRGYEYLLHMQREDGGWALPQHYTQMGWTRSCPWSSYHATRALYAARQERYAEPLRRALGFLVWHLSTKQDDQIRRFFYHGHSTVHELQMFADYRVGLNEQPVSTLLDWLRTMYHADEGCFRYAGKPISRYRHSTDEMDARVAKYRLYHLIEQDWLTYRLTRVAMSL